MKRYLALVLALVMMLAAFTACTTGDEEESGTSTDSTAADETVGEDTKSEGVMTYAEYVAADVDAQVVVETYIQAKQGWWESDGVGVATFYTQDYDGAYFLYNMPCTEDEYAQLTVGTKIKVTGYKSEWSGEVEITDATFEIEEGTYVAEAVDLTSVLGTDSISDYQNMFFTVKGLTVEAIGQDADGNDVAFYYSYDGSGSEGDDLYFNVSLNGTTYTFTVESYLCDSTTDVYNAVEALSVGDVIDVEGFLYWYEGVNPHITSVSSAD
ncbi:MAG: hypothetical protein LUH54_02585 [Firmicutes bacterium]|nr:hypothetical protein [Bacillota bacterium]